VVLPSLILASTSYSMTAGSVPKSRFIATVAMFGALSIILTVVSNLAVKIAFVPPANYLLFDFGEIPVILCFLVLGMRGGLAAAAIEYLALNLLPSSTPIIGPLFKVISVVATISALWLCWRITKNNSSLTSRFILGGIVAAIVRAAALTIPNALFLISFGLGGALPLYLEFTAVFNALQIPFDLIPIYIILQLPQVRMVLRKNGLNWYERTVTAPSIAVGRVADQR
jgi:riboflavin transporter FmnP